MKNLRWALCLLLTAISASHLFGAVDTAAAKARLEKLNSRERRVIWNNDGCELNKVLFKTHTPEFFNSIRNQGVIGKGVDVISFCTLSSGFGMTTARSEIADVALELPAFRDGLQALLDQGTDPLKATVEFSHANNLECYWSFRINDCHDAFRGSEGLFPEFKMKNPETMVGTRENPPPYGYWSAVDFSQKKVREMMFAMFKEIIDNYEIDGIDIDFCRHWAIFKSASWGKDPSREEIDSFTDLMARIRRYADEVGLKRGRPILMMVRIMDSLDACMAMGLDVDRWCREGLVDIVAGGSEIRLNQPDYLAALIGKYPSVRFYMSQTDAQITGQHSLLKRNLSKLNFRAQAAAAYQAGLHGIYSFNEYYPRLPHADYLRDISKPENLPSLNKCYYFSHSYLNPGRYGKNWERFQIMPSLTPAAPMLLKTEPRTLDIYLGQEAAGAKYILLFDVHDTVRPERLSVEFNGVKLPAPRKFYGLLRLDVPGDIVKAGRNLVTVNATAGGDEEILFSGREMLVYGVNQGSWRRLYGGDGFVTGKSERIEEEALVIEDVTDWINNLIMPLDITPDSHIEVKFEAKVLPGSANETSVVRLSNRKFTETVELRPNGVALKFARRFAAMDTVSAFHSYRLELKKNVLTVFVDGKKLLSSSMVADYNADRKVVRESAAEQYAWLSENSLLVGSVSMQGRGGAKYRGMGIINHGASGTIFDGALMVIHDNKAADLPSQFAEGIADAVAGTPDEVWTLDAASYKQWKLESFNAKNLQVVDGRLVLDSTKVGPIIRRTMPAQYDAAEISFSYRTLDAVDGKAQIQSALWAPSPSSPGAGLLYGFRFGADYVRFLDDAPVKFTPAADGINRVRIIVLPAKDLAEVYVGDGIDPLFRTRAFGIKAHAPVLSIGDGTAGVVGKCELFDGRVKIFGVKGLLDTLPETPAFSLGADKYSYKSWKISSVNKTNLTVDDEAICIDSTKAGPIIRHDLEASPEKFLELTVVCQPMEDNCPKAQLQVVATVDNPADQNKSTLYSCRVGKGYLRFGDDKPVNAEPDADGRYTIKILVDCTTIESYFFVNGGKNPVITRKPILINKTQNYVTFGDGSVAVEGKCRIFDISVNAF